MSATGFGVRWPEDTRGLRLITYLSPSIPRTLFEELVDHCRAWPGHERASPQVETRVSGPERGVADPFSGDGADVGFVGSRSYLWLRKLEPSPVELLGVAPVLRDERNRGRPVYVCDVLSHRESATPRSARACERKVRWFAGERPGPTPVTSSNEEVRG